MVKLVLMLLYLQCCGINDQDNPFTSKTDHSELKKTNSILVFTLEDCIENFLEYFYIEKYNIGGSRISYTMMLKILKNIVMYGFKFYSSMNSLKKNRKAYDKWYPQLQEYSRQKEKDQFKKDLKRGLIVDFLFYHLSFLFISIASFMRFYGVLYQKHYGKLDDHCVAVVDGRLIQTPFTTYPDCMRLWEYFYVLFNFYPLFGFIIFYLHKMCCKTIGMAHK